MRLCVLLLLGTSAAALATPDREAAYARLRDEARATKLVEQAAADIKAHRYEAALEKADAAAVLQPGDAVTLNARGAALTELGRFHEAEQALQAASTADPKAFPPQYNLGEVLSLQKKYLDAAGQFASMQSRFGAMPILKFKLYLSYVLAGQDARAKETLATLRYPSDGAAWYYAHAVQKLRDGKRAEAKRLLGAAAAIHGEEAHTYTDTLEDTDLLK